MSKASTLNFISRQKRLQIQRLFTGKYTEQKRVRLLQTLLHTIKTHEVRSSNAEWKCYLKTLVPSLKEYSWLVSQENSKGSQRINQLILDINHLLQKQLTHVDSPYTKSLIREKESLKNEN